MFQQQTGYGEFMKKKINYCKISRLEDRKKKVLQKEYKRQGYEKKSNIHITEVLGREGEGIRPKQHLKKYG